jgi:hypothetical protein
MKTIREETIGKTTLRLVALCVTQAAPTRDSSDMTAP